MLINVTCFGLKMAADVQAILQRVPFRNNMEKFKMHTDQLMSQIGIFLDTTFLNRFPKKNKIKRRTG